MPHIVINTRSYGTTTSRTADRAEEIARIYGVKVTHHVDTDRFNRTASRHRVTLTADRAVLEMLSPDLQKLGIRPCITEQENPRVHR